MKISLNVSRAASPIFSMVLFCFLAVGCGGPEDEISRDDPQSMEKIVRVAIADSVSSETRSKVTKILTPVDVQPFGNQTNISFDTGSDHALVVAVSSTDQIQLMALANKEAISLSSDTTAVALISILAGALPDKIFWSTFEKDIKNSLNYSKLVESITDAHANEIELLDSHQVLSAAGLVLKDYLDSKFQTKSYRPSSKSLAITSPSLLSEQVPSNVVDDEILGLLPVSVSGMCNYWSDRCNGSNALSLAIRNYMPIAWAVASNSASGDILDGPVLMYPANFYGALELTGWTPSNRASTKPYGINTDGKSINLTISMTKESRKVSFINMTTGILKSIAEHAPYPTSCTVKLLHDGVAASAASIDLSNPYISFADVVDEYIDSFKDPTQFYATMGVCAKKWSPKYAQMNRVIYKTITRSFGPTAAVNLIYDISSLAATVAYTAKYWNFNSKTVGVCIDENGQIANCLNSINFSPDVIYATIGVDLSKHVTKQ